MQLILVRYGSHDGERLTQLGRAEMLGAAKELAKEVLGKTSIVTADIPRGRESAEVVADELGLGVLMRKELYAAPEDGVAVDIDQAKQLFDNLAAENDTVIAVVSREYIEQLSGGKNLERGEWLRMEYGQEV
jgi:broad specificity phosphatase PhoE